MGDERDTYSKKLRNEARKRLRLDSHPPGVGSPPQQAPPHVPAIPPATLDITVRKATRKTLQRVTEQAQVDAAPAVLMAFWETAYRLMKAGNTDAMKMVAEAFKYTSKGGGINIFNQQNNVQTHVTKDRSFERIVHALDARDEERKEQQVIEAEFDDSPGSK